MEFLGTFLTLKCRKVFNIGSVLYNVAMELLRTLAQPAQSSKRVISNDLKIQPKKKPLTPFSNFFKNQDLQLFF